MQPAVTESSVASSSGTRGSLNRILYAGIAVLSVAGIIVSAVSLQRHYAKSATQFCDFSQQFSCDVVNRSEYSSIMGIPVAGIGVVGYAVLLALSTFFRARFVTPNRLLGAAIAGLAFPCRSIRSFEAQRMRTLLHFWDGQSRSIRLSSLQRLISVR